MYPGVAHVGVTLTTLSLAARPPTEPVGPDQAEVDDGVGAVVVEPNRDRRRSRRGVDDDVLVDALGTIVAGVVAFEPGHGITVTAASPDSRS